MDISCVSPHSLWNDYTLLGFHPNSSSSVSPTEEMLLNCFHLGPCFFSLNFCSNGIQPDYNVSPEHWFVSRLWFYTAEFPNLFGTRGWFHGRQFFHEPGVGEWFLDDSSELHLLCTVFLLLLHQLHLRSSGIRSPRSGSWLFAQLWVVKIRITWPLFLCPFGSLWMTLQISVPQFSRLVSGGTPGTPQILYSRDPWPRGSDAWWSEVELM